VTQQTCIINGEEQHSIHCKYWTEC